jgi:hypothetical protein
MDKVAELSPPHPMLHVEPVHLASAAIFLRSVAHVFHLAEADRSRPKGYASAGSGAAEDIFCRAKEYERECDTAFGETRRPAYI